MSRVKIVLILTENWTMRPAPDVADLVTFAVEAERAGLDAVMVSEHIVLGPSADAAGLPANPGTTRCPATRTRPPRGPARWSCSARSPPPPPGSGWWPGR